MAKPIDPKPEADKDTASLTYRDADGHPHLVDEQEKAARDAQRSGEQPKGDLPKLAITPPD